MLSKNISLNKVSSILLFLILLAETLKSASLEPDDINSPDAGIKIIYPEPDQIVTAVDSTFILGNVPAENDNVAYKLFINKRFVKVHSEGGFIAFIPVIPGNFEFKLEAYLVNKEKFRHLYESSSKTDIYPGDVWRYISKTLAVTIPQPLKPIPFDSIIIGNEYQPSESHLVLRTGDRLKVSFQGTPACRAWFAIPGVIDSVPMAETVPRLQPYWGESVFGAGAVPDSLKLKGIYSGFFDIPSQAGCDSVPVEYFLSALVALAIAGRSYKST